MKKIYIFIAVLIIFGFTFQAYSFYLDQNKYFVGFYKIYGNKYNKNIEFKKCIDSLVDIKNYNTCLNKLNTNFTLKFGGDIMLSRTIGYYSKKYGYDKYNKMIFEEYHPNSNLEKNTIMFYNLESPFSKTDNDTYQRSFKFASNIKNIGIINNLLNGNNSKSMILLANNHMTNAGGEGIDTTIKTLTENNINYLGIEKEKQPEFKTIFDNYGNKICFAGYSYDGGIKKLSNNGVKSNYYINLIDENKILSDLEKMKTNNCDFKIFAFHWGNEYKFDPNQTQINLAHKIIDNGGDLILGGHSHILGKIEDYKGKKIYYSLGNFIFDQDWGYDGCEKGSDCIYDENLKKNTTPTYIGYNGSLEIEINLNGKNVILKDSSEKFQIKKGLLKK